MSLVGGFLGKKKEDKKEGEEEKKEGSKKEGKEEEEGKPRQVYQSHIVDFSINSLAE